jgi:hypothetical protein
MSRSTQITIGRSMIAIAIIGYLCAFPELAVLLGIGLAALLFVAPVGAASYLACRVSLKEPRPLTRSR